MGGGGVWLLEIIFRLRWRKIHRYVLQKKAAAIGLWMAIVNASVMGQKSRRRSP